MVLTLYALSYSDLCDRTTFLEAFMLFTFKYLVRTFLYFHGDIRIVGTNVEIKVIGKHLPFLSWTLEASTKTLNDDKETTDDIFSSLMIFICKLG